MPAIEAAREETFEHAQALIRTLAARDFEAHALEETGPQEWLCRRPRTGISSFRVIVRPGTVIVYGDIGEGIFRGGGDGDTLHWLCRAVYSPDYLLEKLRAPGGSEKREFYADDALRFLRERAADGPGFGARALPDAEELRRDGELNAHEWHELVRNWGGDSDAHSVGFHYSARALWLVEALKWLVEHLPADLREKARRRE